MSGNPANPALKAAIVTLGNARACVHNGDYAMLQEIDDTIKLVGEQLAIESEYGAPTSHTEMFGDIIAYISQASGRQFVPTADVDGFKLAMSALENDLGPMLAPAAEAGPTLMAALRDAMREGGAHPGYTLVLDGEQRPDTQPYETPRLGETLVIDGRHVRVSGVRRNGASVVVVGCTCSGWPLGGEEF